ncbi:MAG: pitrilysin family protein, partial [Planctomycetota bacterium]
KTGARDEPGDLMGVSHFLEHMMFKGTHDISADELNRGFDDLGARHNAYTSNEVTCFYAQVMPERLEAATDLLGRMMRPALREAEFETEKGVILEEIAMYADNPFWVLYEEAVDRHFRPHPLRHRILGTNETITALTRDQMAGYFESRYAADATTVSLAGALDFDVACAQIEALCGGWAATNQKRDAAKPATNQERFGMNAANVTHGYVLGLSDGPAAGDDRRYAAAMLAQVLGMADNSRLHWSLIETGLADECLAAYDPQEGTGVFYVYASAAPDRLEEVTGVITKECTAAADSLTEDELSRVRSRMATAASLEGERPGDRMQQLGRRWTALGRYETLEERLEKIEAVTLDDLRAVAKDFPMTPATLGTMLPEKA